MNLREATSSAQSDVRNTNATVESITLTENITSHNILEKYIEYQIFIGIGRHKFYILMILALFGNGLSFLVLRKRMSQSSPCCYLAHLSIWDTIVLFEKGAYLIVIRYFPEHFGDVGCRLGAFLIYFAIVYSRWIVVAMTVERFIAVTYPLKAVSLCTVRRAKITLLLLAVVVLLAYAQYLFIQEYITTLSLCVFAERYTWYASVVWPWVHMSLYGYAPLLLVCIFNALIIRKLVSKERENARLGIQTNEATRRKSSMSSATVMLIMVSITFVLVAAPYTLYYTITALINTWAEDELSQARHLLLDSSLILLADLNHCLNFLLYFVSGKSFRNDVRQIFNPCSRPKNTDTISNISQTTRM